MSKIKMRFCFFCGDELGCYADYEPLDTCGKPECDEEAEEQRLRDFEAGDYR